MPIAYILLNSDLGTDESVITKIKNILSDEKDAQYEIQGVYGVYDIILKLISNNPENLRAIITNKIRNLKNIQSTLTMIVIEEQEKP
tara:strand:- start:1429 stop:1689 length:261 start_codon:yes stop_codon:yes gene_type:complete